MKEIEILLNVLESKESAIKKLSIMKSEGTAKIVDIYFFDKKTGRFKPQNNLLDECLRLRQKNGKTILTYKKDRFDSKGTWLYSDEEEVEVADFIDANKLLHALGYEELVRISNSRSIFVNSKYEVVLEDVEELGLMLEIELKQEDNRNILEIKQEMMNFLTKDLKLNLSEELNQGKNELMMRKKGVYE